MSSFLDLINPSHEFSDAKTKLPVKLGAFFCLTCLYPLIDKLFLRDSLLSADASLPSAALGDCFSTYLELSPKSMRYNNYSSLGELISFSDLSISMLSSLISPCTTPILCKSLRRSIYCKHCKEQTIKVTIWIPIMRMDSLEK